jgi:hypothetical protein
MSTPRYIPEDKERREPDGDETVTPSQAEGPRKRREDRDEEGQGHVQPTPSQAEGDRETIERSLEEKE